MSQTVFRALAEARAIDLAVFTAVSRTHTPELDRVLSAVTRAADYSKLSLAAAALLAMTGRPRGRRAAIYGLAALAVTAAFANAVVKPLAHRDRPDRAGTSIKDPSTAVTMPGSSSFPSGHSAAAVAFATGVGHVWPLAAIPLSGLAAVVAYSRVHTGVHYPGDVLAGSLLGGGLALATSFTLDRTWSHRGAARQRTLP